jgi:hypothetical protein
MAKRSPSEIDAEYSKRLGDFIQTFGQLEVALFYLLCDVAEINEEVGRALFSGTRADGLIANIRRCFEARNIDIPEDTERALQQSAILNGARNDTVHLIRDWEARKKGKTTFTNRMRYLPRTARTVTITAGDLEAMDFDAFAIEAFLLNTKYSDESRYTLPRAWRYKPPSQASKGRKTRKTGQKL